MTPWYDTHVHLDRYALGQREAILHRTREAEVELIAVAVDIESSASAVRLFAGSAAIAGVVIGVHPTNANGWPDPQLRSIANEPCVVGIGECGFDSAGPDWAIQANTFQRQCEIARELDLSLVLHIDGDGAWEQLLAHGSVLDGLPVVRHYFTGDGVQAAWHRERGHYLSFGNPLVRRPQLQEVALLYPQEMLLIETDSYPLPGRTTEPAQVALVGETLARIRGWPVEDARAKLQENTKSAFRVLRT